MIRRCLFTLFLVVACQKQTTQSALKIEFASPEPAPEVVDLLRGCEQREAIQLRAFLGLLPPWDKERPPAMLELGFALEVSDSPSCLKAAQRIFFELAMIYPNKREALRATLEVGAISQFLKEPAKELEEILSRYENREARMIEVAKSASGDKGVAFLRAYGGANADALIINYTSWLRRGAPPE